MFRNCIGLGRVGVGEWFGSRIITGEGYCFDFRSVLVGCRVFYYLKRLV